MIIDFQGTYINVDNVLYIEPLGGRKVQMCFVDKSSLEWTFKNREERDDVLTTLESVLEVTTIDVPDSEEENETE